MNKNKKFILFSVLLLSIAFVVAVFMKKEEVKTDISDLADPTILIRDHNFSKGPADAKVTVVEFFDPECEACRAMHPVMKQLMEEFPGKIRLVYRYMPFHTNSLYASSVLEEAKEHGKYEEALDLLFEEQPHWGSHHDPKPELIVGYMKTLGLEKNLFDRDTVIAKHKSKIEMDQKDGEALSVRQTPTYFVNGKKLYNIGYDFIKMAITDALRD